MNSTHGTSVGDFDLYLDLKVTLWVKLNVSVSQTTTGNPMKRKFGIPITYIKIISFILVKFVMFKVFTDGKIWVQILKSLCMLHVNYSKQWEVLLGHQRKEKLKNIFYLVINYKFPAKYLIKKCWPHAVKFLNALLNKFKFTII